MDTLIGLRLVKVERLSWCRPGDPDDLSVGPVHLLFEGGHGVVLDGRSDWSLECVETVPGDSTWRDAYDYDWCGSRWRLRDASSETPFAEVIAEPLRKLERVRNEVDEVIGLHLNFGGRNLALRMWEGEVTTQRTVASLA